MYNLYIMLLVTTVSAQDIDSPSVTEGLPPQVRKGMDIAHDAYRFAAFNCDEPEEVLTQSIPHGCLVKLLDRKPNNPNLTQR